MRERKICFNPSQVFYKRHNIDGHIIGGISFNPSQVFYKPIQKILLQKKINSFNPSQVFYKPVSACSIASNLSVFQSLIGILQTEYNNWSFSTIINVSIPHRYSTNFIITNYFSFPYIVSIPHRYSTNQQQKNQREKNIDCFNPSQVFYKH